MSQPWRLLNQTSSNAHLPPLLISTSFNVNSYTIQLTDLTYIWSETLSRRNIIKRSLDEETSIDPSEDAEQMRVFLEKIKSALEGSTKASLSMRRESPVNSDGPAGLELHITMELPKGLSPLKWPIYLMPMPQSVFSSQILYPLLRAQSIKLRELEGLIEMLKDKDHVIQKVVDRLESTGIELGHVFPGAAGKGGRKLPRKIAEERVKGLGVLDVDGWKHQMQSTEKKNGTQDIMSTVSQIIGADGCSALVCTTDPEIEDGGFRWWDNTKIFPLELSNGTTANDAKKGKAILISTKENQAMAGQDEDDDFQIQSTPPNLVGSPLPAADQISLTTTSSPPTLRSQAIIGDSTDEEEELDGPSQHHAIPDSYPRFPPEPQTQKLGSIGGPKPVTKPPAEIQKLPSRSQAREDPSLVDDDETASEDDGDQPPHQHPLPPRTRTPPPQPPKPMRATLGKIGGKLPAAPPPANPEPEEDTISALPERKPAARELGVIGRRAAAGSENPRRADDDASRGRTVVKAEREEERAELLPRETSLERADRKREELKRLLEEKARAPVKKKRRF